MVGMRERVELLGGTFAVDTAPGQGTRVCLTLPLESGREDFTMDADVEG
ncbi:MAG: hypothetical protein V3W14_01580 [Candidatus Neomarinimicrobiota bacterium]